LHISIVVNHTRPLLLFVAPYQVKDPPSPPRRMAEGDLSSSDSIEDVPQGQRGYNPFNQRFIRSFLL